ncbi:polymer-forming cytoskeletal protein [Candidatus Nitronereus thalassa]|uniref:Polymer-forming cytoskeletal protein n=1 Tax=Candidatus Nitronereus thalassa TaxID=3020898 RepID=A0ABU3K8J3_9BACT|nr:polymer-forming cytoskeletal protein [Candidatus Nitronereus thalassa]MDT7042708.1 polymer-forming cytoskeletal protein [Candidatus Nitronereus thalassa]
MSTAELDEPQTMYAPPTDPYSDFPRDRMSGDAAFGKEKIVAFIGQGVEFKGTINYKGSVRIDGKLDGELHTEGTLLVGKEAVITAKISAGSVISKGKITGDIVANEKVLLLSSANMDGSLNTPQLSIEEGVIFNGTIEMKR